MHQFTCNAILALDLLLPLATATVGDTPACPMTDTCFDSDPSVVGE